MVSQARLATLEDADEVVRLAKVMFTSMGIATDDHWREAAAEAFAARLADDVVGFVVDQPDAPGHLVSGGMGVLHRRLPSPTNPTGLVGYVQWVATDPRWRGRGYARAVLTEVLAWFDTRDVFKAELHATPAGEPLYRSLGFAVGDNPGLRRVRRAGVDHSCADRGVCGYSRSEQFAQLDEIEDAGFDLDAATGPGRRRVQRSIDEGDEVVAGGRQADLGGGVVAVGDIDDLPVEQPAMEGDIQVGNAAGERAVH